MLAVARHAPGRLDRCRYRGAVRIATWNVNSVKQRVPRLLPWLDERRPDVVCLQETKLADDAFAELLGDELAEPRLRGRRSTARRRGTAWRSSRASGWTTSSAGSPARPGFPHPEARAVSATCGGIRVVSVYVPNGRVPDSEHYHYKLAWLASLREMVAAGPEATVVCGDMNIAPTDDDVFDPDAYVGQTHVTPPEREALAELQAVGLRDVVRDRWPDERVFTYWDYRAGMFHQDLGMRIDLVLASAPVADRVQAAWVDRQARKGSGPSDHAPVIVDLDEAPDGDIGPVVPPPSAPVTKRGAKKLPQVAVSRTRQPRHSRVAVAIARGLHALRLARHLRVVGRIGHVALALGLVALVHVQQRLQRVGGVVDRGVAIAHLGEARGHRRDREVLGRDLGELVPGHRRGDRRARLRPDAVGRGDRAVAGVLVVVDEDALAALLLPPLGRHLARQAPLELAPEGDRGVADVGERPARLDPDVDVDAAAARGLREAGVAELVRAARAPRRRRARRRRSPCPAAGRGRGAARPDGRRRRREPATDGT